MDAPKWVNPFTTRGSSESYTNLHSKGQAARLAAVPMYHDVSSTFRRFTHGTVLYCVAVHVPKWRESFSSI